MRDPPTAPLRASPRPRSKPLGALRGPPAAPISKVTPSLNIECRRLRKEPGRVQLCGNQTWFNSYAEGLKRAPSLRGDADAREESIKRNLAPIRALKTVRRTTANLTCARRLNTPEYQTKQGFFMTSGQTPSMTQKEPIGSIPRTESRATRRRASGFKLSRRA